MPDAVLRIDGVAAGYAGREVLSDLSLTCAAGELLGVLGANGCGKTTLVRVAAGLVRPARGCVSIGGDDVRRLDRRELARRVALLAQDGGPLFPITALEAVLLGRHPWQPAFAFEGGEDLALARAALAEVGAAELEERDVATLSGGERQRVLLARALCQGGSLLLCDEPTSHLDLRHQAGVFRLLRQLADGGRAVLVVTHDVDLAAQACDRLAFLRPPGRGPALVALGAPADVLTPDVLRATYGIDADVERGAAPFVRRRL